jgi:hypothetical protein
LNASKNSAKRGRGGENSGNSISKLIFTENITAVELRAFGGYEK